MELPKIKVADFEGPFDLLLHLIKKNKMDIYNVEIYKVTNQYLEYLNTRKVMDLEITSEFIVVAATLIEIKCLFKSSATSWSSKDSSSITWHQ